MPKKKDKIEPIPDSFENVVSAITNAPVVTTSAMPFSKFSGTIDLGGKQIDCYILDTGDRVISLSAAVRSLTGTESGKLGNYIEIEGLKSFINSDKVAGEIIAFLIPGNPNPAKGIKAEVFVEICDAYVKALEAGSLKTDRQKSIALACAILLASCAKVGLIALIDEATGYQ